MIQQRFCFGRIPGDGISNGLVARWAAPGKMWLRPLGYDTRGVAAGEKSVIHTNPRPGPRKLENSVVLATAGRAGDGVGEPLGVQPAVASAGV
jgi:hypothetical protein